MFKERMAKGLQVSALALYLAGSLGTATDAAAQSLVDAMAAQLAARSDVFAATTASLKVLPMNIAGSCPHSFMLKVDLGARSPGTLSYRIETLDGRVSQVFKVRTEAQAEGNFAAKAEHELRLTQTETGEADLSRVVFSAPARPSAAPQAEPATDSRSEPGFFERVFGIGKAAADPADGLRQQSFMVRVVAPNDVASTFDRLSVSCEAENGPPRTADNAAEDQHDDNGGNRGGRDDNGRDSGRGGSGAGGSGPAGTP
jgi:hypothetical protein